jgi:bifunctional ADP-heptose synthase (sugar kinase/adenylyltransferase)
MNILVIGDSCIDIFRYGDVNRLAPEAPVPIIVPESETKNPGMSGNVAVNLRSLGCEVDLITNKESINKIRYVCSKYNYLLLRVDENDSCERISSELLKSINWSKYDAVVISDYCKGFLSEEDIIYISIMHNCTFLDSKRKIDTWVDNISYIKINYQEFEKNENIILENLKIRNKTIITRGKYGCDFRGVNYPTQEVSVKDVSGAGDTFLSGLVFEFSRTKDIIKSIDFAQQCTLIVVQKKGVSTI